jgi:hypothetical protein
MKIIQIISHKHNIFGLGDNGCLYIRAIAKGENDGNKWVWVQSTQSSDVVTPEQSNNGETN